MQRDEHANVLETTLKRFHPALWEVEYLHWALINSESLTDVVLVGDSISCKLMEVRLNQKNIYPIGKEYLDEEVCSCEYPKNATFLITLQDFPGELNEYKATRKKLALKRITRVSVIREFSSGFALGAEKAIVEKDVIRNAYNLLADTNSKNRLLRFLSQINNPYHWNMDICSDNFGIPDPKRYLPECEWRDDLPLPALNERSLLVYCSNRDWNNNDPFLKWSQHYTTSLFCLPDRLFRMKFIEYIRKNELRTKNLFVLDKMLASSSRSVTYNKHAFSGGTPLLYQAERALAKGIPIDTLVSHSRLGTLVLSVDDEFDDIILGAQNSILSDKPTIIIQGFSLADQLWNSISKIANLLPNYSISLFRYATENIIQGYSIFLRWKESKNV